MVTKTDNAALARLDDFYQHICSDFANNVLSAEAARQQVHSLTHTDDDGGTWRIDTKRSGRTARFIHEIHNQTVPSEILIPVASPILDTVELDTPASIAPFIYRTETGTTVIPDHARTRTSGREIGEIYKVRRIASAVAVLSLVAAIALISNFRNQTEANPLLKIPTLGTIANSIANPSDASIPAQTNSATKITTRESAPFNTDIEFGRSVLNQPLIVRRRGVNDGVRILVVGVIHGSERFGRDIVNVLNTTEVGTENDLWLVPTMNPDGEAKTDDVPVGNIELKTSRRNANNVDLNRNFPQDWQSLGKPGDWEYAGKSAGSEPEVQAMMGLIAFIKPQIVIWYHADYFRIAPGTGREGQIRSRYANLVNLPVLPIQGGNYTGTATSWTKTKLLNNGVTFVVEFGKTFTSNDAQLNA